MQHFNSYPMSSEPNIEQPQSCATNAHNPLCTFITGPRDSGKTRYILECLRNVSTGAAAPEGTVAVLLAEEGRTRAESLAAAFRGLVLRRLFLPCQCCPELARLPAALRAINDANPRLEQVYIEVPDITALRFLEEFDATIGWPRTLVLSLSAAWHKARRLDMLLPFQSVLLEKADVILEHEQTPTPYALSGRSTHIGPSPTTAPFNLSLP